MMSMKAMASERYEQVYVRATPTYHDTILFSDIGRSTRTASSCAEKIRLGHLDVRSVSGCFLRLYRYLCTAAIAVHTPRFLDTVCTDIAIVACKAAVEHCAER